MIRTGGSMKCGGRIPFQGTLPQSGQMVESTLQACTERSGSEEGLFESQLVGAFKRYFLYNR